MLVIFQILQIISGLLTVLFVLLHSPKGSGLGAIGEAAQLFSSQRSVEAGLNKITTTTAAVFIITSLILGFDIVK